MSRHGSCTVPNVTGPTRRCAITGASSADRDGHGEHSLTLLKLPGGPSRGVFQRNVTSRSPSPFPKSVTSYVSAAPIGFRTNPPSALGLSWTRWDRSHVPLTFTNVAVKDQPWRG